MVPLGYELKEGKLLIVEEEAQQVRTIFSRYIELGSVNRLVADLRATFEPRSASFRPEEWEAELRSPKAHSCETAFMSEKFGTKRDLSRSSAPVDGSRTF